MTKAITALLFLAMLCGCGENESRLWVNVEIEYAEYDTLWLGEGMMMLNNNVSFILHDDMEVTMEKERRIKSIKIKTIIRRK